MVGELLVVFALMLLNGVFAGAEIAVLSVRKTRLAELLQEGRGGARAVQWLRHEPERFLATVQVGITVVGTSAAAFGGERLAHDFGRALSGLPGVGPYASRAGLVLVVVTISFLEIVVGELVPKSIALRNAERYALAMGPVLRVMATAVKPLVWTLTKVSNAVLKLFGDKTSFAETRLSPEEIQELVEEAARSGTLDPKAGEIASRALDFRELRAVDVMVPRAQVVAVPKSGAVDALQPLLRGRRYARVPVYEGTPDHVVGYIALKDVLARTLEPGAFELGELMRPVRFVPESARAADLLKELQTERSPLAIVVDEAGAVAGLVSVEDLVEELVGEILSEQDPAALKIERAPDGTALVPGATPIRDVNRALDLELPEPEGFNTIAGLCLHLASSIPPPGAKLETTDGTVLEVVESSARRIRTVRVHPAARREAETPPASP